MSILFVLFYVNVLCVCMCVCVCDVKVFTVIILSYFVHLSVDHHRSYPSTYKHECALNILLRDDRSVVISG